MSAGMVLAQAEPEQWVGSAPTMLKPYVTPLFGSTPVPNQWATVFVVGRTDAPPTVVLFGDIPESWMTTGSVLADAAGARANAAPVPRPTVAAAAAINSFLRNF